MVVSVRSRGKWTDIPVELANRLGFTAGQHLLNAEADQLIKEMISPQKAPKNNEKNLTGSPH